METYVERWKREKAEKAQKEQKKASRRKTAKKVQKEGDVNEQGSRSEGQAETETQE